LAGAGGPDDGGARRVDHAFDLGPQALLHDELGAAHVDVEQALGVLRANRGDARAVEDALGPAQRRGARPPPGAWWEPPPPPSTPSPPPWAASRATCDPMKPVAPVMRTLAKSAGG